MEEENRSSGSLKLRSGHAIFPSQMIEIEKITSTLAGRIPAQLIIILDKSGQIISHTGRCDQFDLIGFGSLISADLAASKAIAEYSEEYQDSQTILREGKLFDSLICEASDFLILFVQFSTQISLGWARLLVRDAAKKISEIMLEQSASDKTEETQKTMEKDLVNQIDDRFKDIWKAK